MAKIKESDVILLKQLWATGKVTKAELSRKFGIYRTHVAGILAGRNWRHVMPELRPDVYMDLANQVHREFHIKMGSNRQPCGDQHPASKLKVENVEEIKSTYHPYKRGMAKILADKFHVTPGHVRDIYYGRRWVISPAHSQS